MIRRSLMALAAAAITFTLTVPVARADDEAKIDNPEYKVWSKFKPDTTVSRESKLEMSGSTINLTSAVKLVSVDGDKVVISEQTTVMGHASPAKTREIPAKITADKKWGDSTGKEDAKVGDKNYSCKVYEFKGAPPGVAANAARAAADAKVKVWVSDEVPGGLVKMTVENSRDDQTVKLTVATTSFEAK